MIHIDYTMTHSINDSEIHHFTTDAPPFLFSTDLEVRRTCPSP